MYFETITREQKQNILAALNVNEQSLRDGVRHLMEWQDEQPYLPMTTSTDESMFTLLLLHSKNSLEQAKFIIRNYYRNKALTPAIFANRDPTVPEIRNIMDFISAVPMPKLTPEGYLVLAGKIRYVPSDLMTVEVYMRWAGMALDVVSRKEFFGKVIIICDCKLFPVKAFPMAMKGIKIGFPLIKDILNFGYGKVYLLNVHSVVEPLIAFSKSLVPKKLADKMEVWNKPESQLAEVLPPESLPVEYGGILPPMDELRDRFYSHVCEHREWLFTEGNRIADLSQVSAVTPVMSDKNSLFQEIYGSFRKLGLD